MKDELEIKHVAVGVVLYCSKVLLMKRALDKKHYPGLWENTGGNIEKGETPRQAVLREVVEETNLKCKIIKQGKEFNIIGYGIKWIVHTFLLEPIDNNVTLDREHTELIWIDPKDYKKMGDVTLMEQDFKSLGLI